jgi:hypothetical protein
MGSSLSAGRPPDSGLGPLSARAGGRREDRPPLTPTSRAVAGLGLILTGLLLVLGFTILGSLAAELGAGTALRFLVGLSTSLLLPLLLALWSRSRARARGRRGLPAKVSIALCNLIFVAGAALIGPVQTRRALERHGAWWVAKLSEAVGQPPPNRVVDGSGRLIARLARCLPRSSEVPAGEVARPSSAREAGLGPTPDAAGRPLARHEAGPTADRGDGGASGGEVRVAFERHEGALLVPVRLQGRAVEELGAKMIFDTGASLTTLNEATLRRLGVQVGPANPTVEMRTANGVVRRPLAIIEGLRLGEAAPLRGGLTVAVCDPCAQGEVVGLLGLNVSGQFRVTLEAEAGQLLLSLKPDRNRLTDIQPWVEIRGARGLWRGPLLTVDATIENRAPRPLRNLRIAAVVRSGTREGRIFGELASVAAQGSAPVHLQGLPPITAGSFQLRLEQADW